jgi:hypothetical protein
MFVYTGQFFIKFGSCNDGNTVFVHVNEPDGIFTPKIPLLVWFAINVFDVQSVDIRSQIPKNRDDGIFVAANGIVVYTKQPQQEDGHVIRTDVIQDVSHDHLMGRKFHGYYKIITNY